LALAKPLYRQLKQTAMKADGNKYSLGYKAPPSGVCCFSAIGFGSFDVLEDVTQTHHLSGYITFLLNL
jgi:hypothetical protein